MRAFKLPCLAVVLLFTPLTVVHADVTLPKVIDSHMVLQRDREIPIWGWAAAGEEVAVKLDDASLTTKADDHGNWKVMLPAMKADGKAHAMTIAGKNKIELEDILIGEVWLGSGQSNMEMGIGMSEKAKEEVAAANNPNIRLFLVPKVEAKAPAKDVNAKWAACTPATIKTGGWNGFSAALYYFGKKLNKDMDVPVGLIECAWGGSMIEPWIIANGKGGGMYNGLIAPVKPFAIRGVIWYQGESNIMANTGLAYTDRMKSLIGGWRKEWGYDFPFYYVEIAPFANYKRAPDVWQAQAAALKIPATGMVVTTDLVDNLNDIHPKKKIEVGERLALWALAKDYKKDVVYSGPLYKSMKIDGDKIRLSFAQLGGGLISRDNKPLSNFEIAAADGKFVPAEAKIDGDTVVVSAKGVAAPTQVRFGWAYTAMPNFANKAGLPASPFQTEHWTGGTGE